MTQLTPVRVKSKGPNSLADSLRGEGGSTEADLHEASWPPSRGAAGTHSPSAAAWAAIQAALRHGLGMAARRAQRRKCGAPLPRRRSSPGAQAAHRGQNTAKRAAWRESGLWLTGWVEQWQGHAAVQASIPSSEAWMCAQAPDLEEQPSSLLVKRRDQEGEDDGPVGGEAPSALPGGLAGQKPPSVLALLPL